MSRKHTSYFNLLEALRQPGCALCRLGGAAAERFLEALLYEYVNDPPMRQAMVSAHGLCPAHSDFLVAQHDALGTAIIYNSIIAHFEKELPDDNGDPGLVERLRGRRSRERGAALAAHAPCPACSRRDETTARALTVFADHHGDEAFRAALAASSGLCLPHLRQALETLPEAAVTVVLGRQRQAWEALRAELAELIRKYDYRFQGEKFGAEEDAWQRAVRFTVGEPGVF